MGPNLLFSQRLPLKELLQFLNVPVAVECDAVAFTTVPSGATRLLVIALQGLRHVVVNDIPDVRLIDAHAKCDGRHDDVHVLHQELILDAAALVGVHPCMVPQGLDPVDTQYFGDFFHLFAAQAINNAALANIGLGMAHNLLQRVLFRTDFVKQVFTVKRRLEESGVLHAEVLLDVRLNFRRRCRGKGDDGYLGNLIDDGPDAPVFRAEVVPPFGNAVGFIHRNKADAHAAQEIDVVLLGEALRGDVQQLGQTGTDVLTNLSRFSFGQTGIQEVRNGVPLVVAADGVHLVFHECNERRDDDGRSFHHQRRQLIAHGLAASCGHDDKGIISIQDALHHLLLLSFEFVESKKMLERLRGRQF